MTVRGPARSARWPATSRRCAGAIVAEIGATPRRPASSWRRPARSCERSNEDLEQFAYVASHDLQEPLRKVASFCQLLQRRYAGELDERADQYIEFAVDGAKRMQQLINDLLAFSRVGRTDGTAEASTPGVARPRCGHLAAPWRRPGATVTRRPLPRVPGDPTLLTQLFQNLLGNAREVPRRRTPPRVHVSAVRDGRRWRSACRRQRASGSSPSTPTGSS